MRVVGPENVCVSIDITIAAFIENIIRVLLIFLSKSLRRLSKLI